MSDDFSKEPVSIGEVRAEKSGLAKHRTPRDVLIQMLREIDSGEISPDFMVLGWGKRHPDMFESGVKFGGNGNSAEYWGLASRVLQHSHT